MDRPSAGPRSNERSSASTPETFEGFCQRLRELTAAHRQSWVASIETDSTNSQGRRFLERCQKVGIERPPAVCFVAWGQTGGRGRAGRTWSSVPGLGLYMTMLLPDLERREVSRLPLVVPVVLARLIEGMGLPARIKWPNDLLVHGRKLAGVLIEAATRGGAAPGVGSAAALAGVGINVHHDDAHRPEARATSLALEGGADLDLAALAVSVASSVDRLLSSSMADETILEEYRQRSQHEIGDRLRCRRGDDWIEGEFRGFDPSGALLLESSGRLLELASSEIVEW